ncbi:hypothetical protein BDK51DRAFT_34083 [Blyttiomyces helicus]|uniref:Uncharacterized protein n=1 Tax=Blyttiomyces helicus TaxID=388810 RepID=A0A4P9WRT3_9FUNG|nr:hypothetical protein BDK51DRAFT_34083 [Blyttiomyces helicus]|eukprot:RKO94010.1 hypothetical protein BDK51DRAFT_34083 [Blyttiomyces helicus]
MQRALRVRRLPANIADELGLAHPLPPHATYCYHLTSNIQNVTMSDTAYPLAINDQWLNATAPPGPVPLVYSNITFSNVNGSQLVDPTRFRAAIWFNCLWPNSCLNITLDKVNIWSSDGSQMTASCKYATGNGSCLNVTGAGKALPITRKFDGVAVPLPLNDPFVGPWMYEEYKWKGRHRIGRLLDGTCEFAFLIDRSLGTATPNTTKFDEVPVPLLLNNPFADAK